MSEIANMADGYYNLLRKKIGLSNEEVEYIAKIRMAHCDVCTKDGNPVKHDGRCTICNCILESSTRSRKKKCPLAKW